MLDYETYCKIRDHYDHQRLTITQTARAQGCIPRRYPSGSVSRSTAHDDQRLAKACWIPIRRSSWAGSMRTP